MIAEKLLEPARTRAHLPVIFSTQEKRSWNVPGVAWVCVLWQQIWARYEERCTAVHFGTTLVMAFHAPGCGKDLGVRETFILNVPRVLREGRRGGAREFYSTGDLRVELGLLFTDEEDIEEFNEMCGPLCCQGCENHHGGFKKLMWYGIMKKFNCKATSTWSMCGRGREKAFNHQHFGEEGEEGKAKRDCIIRSRWKWDGTYVYNDEKVWDS